MSDEVVRILRGMAGELSLFGDVLILGDSTSAYCVDRENELSRMYHREKAKEGRGINFISNPGLGRHPPTHRAFLNQVENAAWRGFSYGWVILLGGRNSDGIPREEVSILFGDLFAYCNDNLIRQ